MKTLIVKLHGKYPLRFLLTDAVNRHPYETVSDEHATIFHHECAADNTAREAGLKWRQYIVTPVKNP